MANKKISEFPVTTSLAGNDAFLINHLGSTNTVSFSSLSAAITNDSIKLPSGATGGQVLTYNGSTTTWVASAVPKELPSTATTGQVLTYNGSTTTWVASAAPAPATSSNAFAAKAWVNFDGTTTPPSIRSAFNVSSVTRNNTGDFTINFTNPMVDANYCFAVGSASVGGGGFITQNMVSQTVNNINFTLLYSSSITLGNSTVVSLIIFGN